MDITPPRFGMAIKDKERIKITCGADKFDKRILHK